MTVWVLVSLHMLADFTLQPTSLVKAKTAKVRFLLLHALIYTIVFAASFLIVSPKAILLPFIIVTLSHCAIDFIRVAVDKRWKKEKQRFASFVMDQLLHVGIIVLVYYCFGLSTNNTPLWQAGLASETVRRIIVYAVMLIIIWEPTAVFIKKLLSIVSQAGGITDDDSNAGAGKLIGELERVIIAVLVVADQLGVIGFVLTAKSLARFKQLEDKSFSEKYLIGTLTSTSVAVIVALVLMQYTQ